MSTHRPIAGRTTVLVRLLVVLVLLGSSLFLKPTISHAYSCGDPSSGHCYGTAAWQEHPEYFGAYTDLRMVNLSCSSSCGGFVDDEIWLVDRSSPSCTANPYGMCWEETGIIAISGSSPVYFWADARPQNTSTFNLHLMGGIDPAGTVDHFMIVKDGRVTPNTFLIFDYNDSLSTLYEGVSVTSGTPMQGKQIIIGQELAGSGGASAPSTSFTRNIWAVQALGPEYVFWYNRELDAGSVGSQSPPFASWAVNPSSPPPPEGGSFTTSCC